MNWTRIFLIFMIAVLLVGASAGVAMGLLPGLAWGEDTTMWTKTVPTSGEQLPVIGLGTYSVFDVDDPSGDLLDVVARAAGTDTETIELLNPQLVRGLMGLQIGEERPRVFEYLCR